MKKDKQAYAELVKKLSPKSDMAKGVWRAFAVGGLICVIGQAINDVFSYGLKWGTQSAATATSICLVFLSALLTGLGVYDRIGKYAGAGVSFLSRALRMQPLRLPWSFAGKDW